MPQTEGGITKTQREFYRVARFPSVIGALDCTHVAIQSPGGDRGEIYRNRKGYFSINVQAICDANIIMTNIVSRWPGSTHDATIFNNSQINASFEAGEFPNCFLLGDSGYPSKSFLMTPIGTPTTPVEQLYNRSHTTTRNCIERCFGVIKRRFPCLKLGLRVKLNHAYMNPVACAVLHNIAASKGDAEPPNDADATEGRQVFAEVPGDQDINVCAGGAAVRTRLINEYFARQ